MSLSSAPFGRELTIKQVNLEDKMKKHLMNMGILAGESIISLYGTGGDIIVLVKSGRIALGKALSSNIIVE